MSSQRCIDLVIVAFALVFSANVSTAKGQQKPLTADQTQIVNKVSTIFTAAETEDIAKFDCVIVPNFYIFANGTRFSGDAIRAVIKAQHAAGKRYDERVTEPDIHISGNIAGLPTSIKGASPTPQAPRTRTGWNHPSSRNRRASGRSPSCTARASYRRLRRITADEMTSR